VDVADTTATIISEVLTTGVLLTPITGTSVDASTVLPDADELFDVSSSHDSSND
jgi:hypothetical protein